jgi:hypothetical protein
MNSDQIGGYCTIHGAFSGMECPKCRVSKKPIMTPEQINKEFAELAGICWHELNLEEYCPKCGKSFRGYYLDSPNPDFCADPRLVLKVMKRDYDTWLRFLTWLDKWYLPTNLDSFGLLLLDTTGKLALAAIAFLGKKRPS